MSLIVCRRYLFRCEKYDVMYEHETDIKKRFGLAVKRRRLELGISQEELADRANLHRTYISDIERGSRNVALENIEKVTKALEISVSKLFADYGIEVKE